MRPDHPDAICGAGWAYSSDRAGWDKSLAFLGRCKALQTTSAQDLQLIDAKMQGLVAMQNSGQLQPAAEQKRDQRPAKHAIDDPAHERRRPAAAPAEERQPSALDLHVLGTHRALEHLQRRVMRAGKLLHHDRHVGEIARYLQALVEGEDRLDHASSASSPRVRPTRSRTARSA